MPSSIAMLLLCDAFVCNAFFCADLRGCRGLVDGLKEDNGRRVLSMY